MKLNLSNANIQAVRNHAFSVAKTADYAMVQRIHSAVNASLQAGDGIAEFRARLHQVLVTTQAHHASLAI